MLCCSEVATRCPCYIYCTRNKEWLTPEILKFVWMYYVNEDRAKFYFREWSSILICTKCMLVFVSLNKFNGLFTFDPF